ncbi:alanine--tRNA ligase [cyanobacterium endosymbiont of Epithemia turgida]|uniref:alanine--tRNA ligase n=1 Tax=cyanobacterium endosymbiont of Epithemia turgida TaxID=718217 RepID=UPI0004D14DEA|nr:alanine--tRNA ligase [cyanobacterium endosymbiont of Epithemia turgida]BAP17496.1 alanyl-tRNA synthetase [cyanobacterium endosymbiont of Epithemia turgida isolate EtSB Lake Yunoko]
MARISKTPKSLTGAQIRDKFLKFYEKKQHKILPSASLIPEDPTVLLTIAGMLPFKPIFLGKQKPDYPRVTTSQKCIRTNDIDNVGRTARHHTFFEMLGNFSFGDYFKEEAIVYAWELSTQVFELSPENLVVSVFEDDDEAFAIWRDKIGIPPCRIQRMGEKDNFWKAGPTGPCGPCSEMYYDFSPELGDNNIDLEDDSRFIEFYNLVFMQYNRDAEGNLTPLENKNIDTGMGLERMAQILQKVPNNYETDLIFAIIETAAKIAGINYRKTDKKTKISLKVIGDHVRSVVNMIADGITVSNTDRGYVLRRLIRRVVRHGRLIGIDGEFITKVAETAMQLAEEEYPNVKERKTIIKKELQREESRFLETLERGEKLLVKVIENTDKNNKISGVDAFTLYDTYGFPLELTQEIAEEQGFTVDVDGFEVAMKEQKERSKADYETIDLTVEGSLDKLREYINPTFFLGYTEHKITAKVKAILVKGKLVNNATSGTNIQIILDQTPFYGESGGQIGDRGYLTGDNLLICIKDVKKESGIFIHFGRVERGTIEVENTITATINTLCRHRVQAHHTATHLLQAALKKVVDNSIFQSGSLVSFERLRFDFNCIRSIRPEELQEIETLINSWISEAYDTQISVMELKKARDKGAIAMFGEKYSTEVRVIDIPGVSMELCGGTHVKNTAEIGLFKIIHESGISSGVRRIEAVAGHAVLEYLNVREIVIKELCDRFKIKPEEISNRIKSLQSELKTTQKTLELVKQELAIAKSDKLLSEAEAVGSFKILVSEMGDLEGKDLQTAAERLQQKLGEAAVILASVSSEGKVNLVAAFSKKVNKEKKLMAGKFIGEIAQICGGGGGGSPNLAQAGGKNTRKLAEALLMAKQRLIEQLQ